MGATQGHVGAASAHTATPLYWNRQGQVNCADHAPYRYSDTWINEGWKRTPKPYGRFMADIKERLHGQMLECETCRAITREGR